MQASEQLVQTALIVGGAAGLLALAAWTWIVVLAMKEDIFSGILCLMGGIYSLYYGVTRWDVCKIPFIALCIFGVVSCSALSYHVVHADYADELAWVLDLARQRFDQSPEVLTSEQIEQLLAADKDRLQGRWVVSSSRQSESVTFEGNECRFRRVEGELALKFDLVPVDGYRAIDISAGQKLGVTKGIYVLASGKLKMCLGTPDGTRPTQFKTIKDKQELFILRRPWN